MPTAYKEDVIKRHKRAKSRSNSGLQAQRQRQHTIVFNRASKGGFGAKCEICKWNVATDLHHVYGRGRNKDDWREQEDALLAVCRECHPLPIQVPNYPSDEGGKKAETALRRIFGDDIVEEHRKSYLEYYAT